MLQTSACHIHYLFLLVGLRWTLADFWGCEMSDTSHFCLTAAVTGLCCHPEVTRCALTLRLHRFCCSPDAFSTSRRVRIARHLIPVDRWLLTGMIKARSPLTAWEREWKWVSGRGGWVVERWWSGRGGWCCCCCCCCCWTSLPVICTIMGNHVGGWMPELTSRPPSLTGNEDGRRGRWRLDTLRSLLPFLYIYTQECCCCCCMQLSQDLWCVCVCVWVCVSVCSVCVLLLLLRGVVLRPWCAALSFRERSHRQPPQEALAPPPRNDTPPPPSLLLPPLLLLLLLLLLLHPPFLFSDLTQQAGATALSER